MLVGDRSRLDLADRGAHRLGQGRTGEDRGQVGQRLQVGLVRTAEAMDECVVQPIDQGHCFGKPFRRGAQGLGQDHG